MIENFSDIFFWKQRLIFDSLKRFSFLFNRQLSFGRCSLGNVFNCFYFQTCFQTFYMYPTRGKWKMISNIELLTLQSLQIILNTLFERFHDILHKEHMWITYLRYNILSYKIIWRNFSQIMYTIFLMTPIYIYI